MRYTIRFLPEVEEDIIAGYAWYEKKASGLGEEFLRMFYACRKWGENGGRAVLTT
jgi:hypothetical protein